MAKRSATAPANGSKPTLPEGMGAVRTPLDKPKAVASLSVAEAGEIKERKRLLEAKINELNDAQKILTLLRGEQQRFMQSLIESKGLSLKDDYNVDSESGTVFLTATYVEPEVEPLETEPIAIADGVKG